MKVKYTGRGATLTKYATYEVVENVDAIGYFKIRNDHGNIQWYAMNQFSEVKDNQKNVVNNHLVNKIERELKETEERMSILQKELENAKNPPTNNILLRQSRLDSEWSADAFNILDDFADQFGGIVPELNRGLAFDITSKGDGIVLDSDYRWEICQDGGRQVLLILDK